MRVSRWVPWARSCGLLPISVLVCALGVGGAAQDFLQPTGPGLRSVYAAEFSYTAGGDSSWDDDDYGKVETFRTRVSYSLSWTPGAYWNWRIGPGWDYFAFRAADNAPFPDELHGVGLRLGGSWRPARRWTVLAEARPGLYSDLVDVDNAAYVQLGIGGRF